MKVAVLVCLFFLAQHRDLAFISSVLLFLYLFAFAFEFCMELCYVHNSSCLCQGCDGKDTCALLI
jgi:hypothetical protein